MKLAYVLLGIAAGPVLCGCNKQSTASAATNSPARPSHRTNVQYHLNQAQPKLPVVKLWVSAEELQTEVASTVTQISTGMMFRDKMAENEAMLFVFGAPDQRSFYMKNCIVALSAAYIDPEGTILEIVPLQPGVEAPVPSKSDNVQYVLEVKQGWFDRHNVRTGAVLRTESGALRESFAGRAMLR